MIALHWIIFINEEVMLNWESGLPEAFQDSYVSCWLGKMFAISGQSTGKKGFRNNRPQTRCSRHSTHYLGQLPGVNHVYAKTTIIKVNQDVHKKLLQEKKREKKSR